jgi:lipocalin
MSDIYSVLSSAYTATPATPASNTPYTNVDAASYQGTWSGTYSTNNQKFELTISQVNGFRAQVKYQSGSTVQYQSVLIKDNSFRVGDTKFSLNANGGATVGTVITSPVDGSTTLIQGSAAQSN